MKGEKERKRRAHEFWHFSRRRNTENLHSLTMTDGAVAELQSVSENLLFLPDTLSSLVFHYVFPLQECPEAGFLNVLDKEIARVIRLRDFGGMNQIRAVLKCNSVIQTRLLQAAVKHNYSPRVLNLEEREGNTGYIDFVKVREVESPIAFGVDCHGRPFVCYRAQHCSKKIKMVITTLFQRYEHSENFWMFAGTVADTFFFPREELVNLGIQFCETGKLIREKQTITLC